MSFTILKKIGQISYFGNVSWLGHRMPLWDSHRNMYPTYIMVNQTYDRYCKTRKKFTCNSLFAIFADEANSWKLNFSNIFTFLMI